MNPLRTTLPVLADHPLQATEIFSIGLGPNAAWNDGPPAMASWHFALESTQLGNFPKALKRKAKKTDEEGASGGDLQSHCGNPRGNPERTYINFPALTFTPL